jgi:hypothetical protein
LTRREAAAGRIGSLAQLSGCRYALLPHCHVDPPVVHIQEFGLVPWICHHLSCVPNLASGGVCLVAV